MQTISVDLFVKLFVFSVCHHAGASQFRRPWLTKEQATVLELKCQVPFETFRRTKGWSVDSIEIELKQQATSENLKLLTVSASGKFEGSGLPQTSEVDGFVKATNDKEQRVPFASIIMPANKNLLGLYSCLIAYTDISDTQKSLSFLLDVNETSVEQPVAISNSSFTAQSIMAEHVNITWAVQKTSDPVHMKIYRVNIGLDKDGLINEYLRFSAVANNGEIQSSVPDIRLAKVILSASSGGNYTVSFYAQSDMCHPFCSYRCQATHNTCPTSDAKACSCEGPGVSPTVGTSEGECSKGGYIAAVVLEALVLLACFVAVCLHLRRIVCGKRLISAFLCCPKPPDHFTKLVSLLLYQIHKRQLARAIAQGPEADHQRGEFGVQHRDLQPNDQNGDDRDVNRGLAAAAQPGPQPGVQPELNGDRPDVPLLQERYPPREEEMIQHLARALPAQEGDTEPNNEFTKVAAGGDGRLVCESKDLVLLFGDQGTRLLYGFVKVNNQPLEEERAVKDAMRGCQCIKNDNKHHESVAAAKGKLMEIVRQNRRN